MDSEIIGLKENQFSIYKSEMSNEEIEKVNLLFGKYNDLKNNIQVEEFITELESIVEFVSQNIDIDHIMKYWCAIKFPSWSM